MGDEELLVGPSLGVKVGEVEGKTFRRIPIFLLAGLGSENYISAHHQDTLRHLSRAGTSSFNAVPGSARYKHSSSMFRGLMVGLSSYTSIAGRVGFIRPVYQHGYKPRDLSAANNT